MLASQATRQGVKKAVSYCRRRFFESWRIQITVTCVPSAALWWKETFEYWWSSGFLIILSNPCLLVCLLLRLLTYFVADLFHQNIIIPVDWFPNGPLLGYRSRSQSGWRCQDFKQGRTNQVFQDLQMGSRTIPKALLEHLSCWSQWLWSYDLGRSHQDQKRTRPDSDLSSILPWGYLWIVCHEH